jgi:hypothetical protein
MLLAIMFCIALDHLSMFAVKNWMSRASPMCYLLCLLYSMQYSEFLSGNVLMSLSRLGVRT